MFKSIYTTRMSGSSRVLKKRFDKIIAKPIKFRKIVSLVCVMLILATFVSSTVVMAQLDNEADDYTLEITNNGEVIELNSKPFIENGEVYVPLRELFTKLGLMESENAKMDWDNGVVLISLFQKNLNEGVVAEYTSYLYKIEIGVSELVVNPEILMVRKTPDEITSVVEPMDSAPIHRRNVTYIPFSYAVRMAERADYGYLSPPDLYELDILYSGETISIAYPIAGYYEITQGFGKRVHPITGEEMFHNGVDFKAEEGTPVLSGFDGKITNAGFDKKNGNYVTISNEKGVEITYCHLESSVFWETGLGKQGDVIGYVGNTGMSTGAHLHMEVKINGEYVDPEKYLVKSRYDELLLKIAEDVPGLLEWAGYPNADYKVLKCSIDETGADVEVELMNYENRTLSIWYWQNIVGDWWFGGMSEGSELLIIQ